MTGAGGRAAVVVVNYASHDLLDQNLPQLTDSGLGPVIVVDNPRTPRDTMAIGALAHRRGWELVRLARNDGFGAGVNAGAERAWSLGCSAMIVINPDACAASSTLLRMRDAVMDNPGALVAPRVVDASGRPWSGLGEVDVAAGRLRNAPGPGPSWVSGACFAIHADLWRRLGGFDPDYFMYWEDVDLAVRCQRAGGSVAVAEDLTVVHDPGGTQGAARGKSALYYYFNCRNRLVFAAKELGARDRWRWIRHTPSDVRRVVHRGAPMSRIEVVRRAVPPAARGVLAGLWWMVRHPSGRTP